MSGWWITPSSTSASPAISAAIAMTGDESFAVGNRIVVKAPRGWSLTGSASTYRDNLVDAATTHCCGGRDIGKSKMPRISKRVRQ
jgi:hypothetical protein